MWRILLESLKKGVATVPLPEPPPERFRGLVTLDAALCDQSADCVKVCPTAAITLEPGPAPGGSRWEVDHAKCIFCGLCQEACPRGAITLSPHYELAVRRREDLKSAVTLASPDAEKGS